MNTASVSMNNAHQTLITHQLSLQTFIHVAGQPRTMFNICNTSQHVPSIFLIWMEGKQLFVHRCVREMKSLWKQLAHRMENNFPSNTGCVHENVY